ncbi:MAG: patatin-like phospholipase family protein, partial [Myxococcota bacterium]
MAATSHDPILQSRQLIERWRSLEMERLMSLGPTDLLRAARLLFKKDPPPPKPGSFSYGGLLDTSGLERFVLEAIPWRNIRRNMRQGHLSALSISTTHVGTGHTVVFISSRDPTPIKWSRDPFVRHEAAAISPRHVLASAAIPLLFPAVKIKSEFYTDGGLRQNTPMSPAIRLGADRILLVSLRHVADAAETARLKDEREVAFPKPLYLLGKALNALLLDHTDYDLDRMRRINAILKAGTESFGPDFVDVLNRKLVEMRGAALRPLRALHIRPSIDIGVLAADFVASGRTKIRGRMARRLVSRLAEREAPHESDLLSYLLFDGNYAAELIDLGYRDAMAQEDALVAFFTEDMERESFTAS